MDNVKPRRGRKPKTIEKDDKSEEKQIETEELLVEQTEPKKRGRRPKDKLTVVQNKEPSEETSENIILHIPVNSKNLEVKPDLTEPMAYSGHTEYFNLEFDKPMDEKTREIVNILNDNEDSYVNQIASTDFTINNLNGWTLDPIHSNEIYERIRERRLLEEQNQPNPKTVKNLDKCLIQFEETNKNNSWPSSTSICCWHDCHQFDGPPCSLPVEFKNNVFKVKGVFCSPECAAAFNFNEDNDGGDKWERYSLLNFLYRRVYNNPSLRVKLASSKLTLKMFGGNLTIKEFRANNCNQDKSYKIVMPPMISILPVQQLVENEKGFSSKQDKKTYVIDKTSSNDNSGLVLKRTKPFKHTENTLEKCMNLSIDQD